MAGLVENSTALFYPVDDQTNAIAEPLQAPTSARLSDLLPNDATEQVWWPPRYAAPTRIYGLVPNDATKQARRPPRYAAPFRLYERISNDATKQVGQYRRMTAMCGYGLIQNDATKQVWHHPRHAIRDSFDRAVIEFSDAMEYSVENPIIEFSDAMEYSVENPIIEFSDAFELPFADIADEFTSFNNSVFDVGTSNQEVEEHLGRLCSVAHEEQFEVGIESRFSGGLQRLCAYDPVAALQSLKVRLIDNDASSVVLAEILWWASRQEAGAIRNLVVDLLSTGLQHASPLVRDAAALSLACLEESAAIVHLRRALEKENVPELRKDLEDLIRSLEN